MKTIQVLLRKEFRQIFRNTFILILMLELPVIQLLVLPLAASYEMKNISLSVVDRDHSSYSQKLIDRFTSSGYFKLMDYSPNYYVAMNSIETNKADLILEIPTHFERDLVVNSRANLLLHVNAIDGSKAGLASSYSSSIVQKFNQEIREKLTAVTVSNAAPRIDITYSNWFNPSLNYQLFMVPGILVTLLSLVGGFLAALNIVTEKENGTMEQINVSPVNKTAFIFAKTIPFLVIGLVIFTIGLLICLMVYHLESQGSYFTLYAFAVVYLIALIGFGFLISTYSDNQQQAMFTAFFFMIIFILLSGEFTPISSMPHWAQIITRFNPLTYLVEVMRLVMLKGSSFRDVLSSFFCLCGFGTVFYTWAIWNYRKTN